MKVMRYKTKRDVMVFQGDGAVVLMEAGYWLREYIDEYGLTEGSIDWKVVKNRDGKDVVRITIEYAPLNPKGRSK